MKYDECVHSMEHGTDVVFWYRFLERQADRTLQLEEVASGEVKNGDCLNVHTDANDESA